MPKNTKRGKPPATPGGPASSSMIAGLVERLRDLPASADPDDVIVALGADMAVVPTATRVLGNTGDDQAIAALEALLTVPAVALHAVEALGHVRDEAAVRLLEQVASTRANKEVGKAARRALHALASTGLAVDVPRPSAQDAVFQPLPAEGVDWAGALASPFDAEGSRSLLVGQKRLPTGAATAIAVTSERGGLIYFQAAPQTHRQLDKEWQTFLNERPDTLAQEIPFGYAQWLLAEAAQQTTQLGNPIPEEYTAWLEFAGRHPASVSPTLIYEEVGVDPKEPPVVGASQAEELLDEVELAPWSLAIDTVSSYVDELVIARNSPIILSDAAEVTREYQIGARAADQLFTSEIRQQYRRRLEETALLFQRSERTEQAQAALASAIALADSTSPASDISFAVSMALRDIVAAAESEASTSREGEDTPALLLGAGE